MTRAIFFFLSRTLRNRIRSRIKRLRTPRYLVSALAGAAYLAFVLVVQFGRGTRHMVRSPRFAPDPDVMAILEVLAAVLLMMAVLLPWLSPAKPSAVLFTEAEIQFLFPAPIPRRTLLRFRIVKGQAGIIFGVLVSGLLFARPGLVPHPGFLLVGFWVAYTFLALYRIGTSLAKTSLAEHGVSGLKRQGLALVAVVVVLTGIVLWTKWYVHAPSLDNPSPRELLRWLKDISEAGPAWVLLLPFRALVRPAFAPDFPGLLDRLVPACALLGAAYWWVMRSHASFEDAALERAEAAARRIDAVRAGAPVTPPGVKVPRVPFALAAQGPSFVAFTWKNLISVGRIRPAQLLLVLAAFGVSIGVASIAGQTIPSMLGAMAAGVVIFLTMLGPVVVRNDLRLDLPHFEIIKPYPLAGWTVVLGELLAPAVLLAATQWVLILLAALLLPSLGGEHWTALERVSVAAGAAILCPCVSLVALEIQNAAALVLPGWMQLGKRPQRGIEAMGQRLITMIATALVLLVAVLPAAIIFAVAYFSAFWVFGFAVVPVAAAVAGMALISEAALGVLWLGRRFERLDVSAELSAPYV